MPPHPIKPSIISLSETNFNWTFRDSSSPSYGVYTQGLRAYANGFKNQGYKASCSSPIFGLVAVSVTACAPYISPGQYIINHACGDIRESPIFSWYVYVTTVYHSLLIIFPLFILPYRAQETKRGARSDLPAHLILALGCYVVGFLPRLLSC